MLKEAMKKVSPSEKIKFVISNASYLPYADNTFDAIFHIGGINTFTEIERAFKEFVRVVKPGGNIVLSDEGMAPWLLNTEYGSELIKLNGLYKEKVPLQSTPKCSRCNTSLGDG